MERLKLTKGELKGQRDALWHYERYLPTLQLKKQQLQLEISRQLIRLEERNSLLETKKNSALVWAGLLADSRIDLKPWLIPGQVITSKKNIAGVDIALFEQAEFDVAEYDLFLMPLWLDNALEILRAVVSLKEEIRIIENGVSILRQELRITTQRVNLFEKVKIPAAKEAIRLIKIYLGDQLANAVGRSKIAKDKLETENLQGVAV